MTEKMFELLVTGLPAIIVSLGTLVTVVVSLIVNMRSNRAVEQKVDVASAKVDATAKDVEHVKVATNSMKDALVAAAFAEGEEKGKAFQKALQEREAVTRAEGKKEGRAEAAVERRAPEPAATPAVPAIVEVDTMHVTAEGPVTVEQTKTKK